MRSVGGGLIVVGVILLAAPLTAFAQEATVSGTVTDSTGGVLPGVTVTAIHEASGNTFEAITDDRGAYRIAVRTGLHRVTAALQGFTTVNRTGLELLVGQQAVVNLQMAPSGLQDSVTVTGEAPLIDVTSSVLGGNVDPRQVSEKTEFTFSATTNMDVNRTRTTSRLLTRASTSSCPRLARGAWGASGWMFKSRRALA